MHAPPKRWVWVGLIVVVLIAIFLYFHFDLGQRLSLDFLKQRRDSLVALYQQHPLLMLAAFFGLYVAMAALSIPGATIFTLASGTIFGFAVGLVVVSFAASVGATLAFLTSRYLLRDTVQSKFSRQLGAINEGMQRDGTFYLLTLRLIPAFPFFLVNLLVGLTPIAATRFYWVSQLGMLPATAIYVNTGTQIASIQKASDALSPGLLASLVLLGIFPLIAKSLVSAFRTRKIYKDWKKPDRYDRNLIVIGAGSGGLVSAYIAATVKAEVTLVESHKMGGDCLNYGCVPSKTLIRSARMASELRRAADFGIRDAVGTVDFAAVMTRVHTAIRTIAPHDSIDRYRSLGVDVIKGHARITSPWVVEIDGDDATRRLTARSIVIATGSSPLVPPIPGLEETGYLTSDNVWDLTELPNRLIVLGGGPIGCELAQSFARLGSRVMQIEMGPVLLSKEDAEISALVAVALRADSVEVLLGHEALRCELVNGVKRIVVKSEAGERAIEFDTLLCAVGRSPRVNGFGLEELGIKLSPKKTIEHDTYLQTNFPNIYVVGDVAGPFQFTHTASHQAWYAAINALFGRFKRFKVDYSVVPWATFTQPEVARVGLSEAEARDQHIDYEITRFSFDELDRAIADSATQGSIKVLTEPGKDRILGVVIVGEHASDLLAEYVLAMKHGLGLRKILGTIHTYPTFSEANKAVAGAWRRSHVPQRLVAFASRFHRWMRT